MALSTNTARYVTIAILAGCSAFGAYATMGTSSRNGLFAALTKAAGHGVKAKSKYFPGGPAPYKTTYTGVEAIDNQLLVLIGFFSVILGGGNTLAVSWVTRYLTTQFLAGWLLISVEGLRQGNKGRVVSWTGTFGFILQNISYTITIPIYLIIHLLTSPVSGPSPSLAALSVDAQDLFILPFSVIGSFIVPTVMMALPTPSTVTPAAHYNALAIWQVFPAAQSVYHGIWKRITAPINFKQNAPQQMDDLYRFVSGLAFVPHTTLLAVAATPARLVPQVVTRYVPGFTRQVFEQINLVNAFVPHLPWNSPKALGLGARVIKPEGLTELVKMFLQWDLYIGGLAVLVWSVFVYSVARPETSFLKSILPRTLIWTVLGGPVGAAAMLLWERDASARQRGEEPKTRTGPKKK